MKRKPKPCTCETCNGTGEFQNKACPDCPREPHQAKRKPDVVAKALLRILRDGCVVIGEETCVWLGKNDMWDGALAFDEHPASVPPIWLCEAVAEARRRCAK